VSAARIALLQGWIADLEARRHELAMGRAVTKSSIAGESTETQALTLAEIDALLSRHRAELAALQRTRQSGVIRPILTS
jgi:hypothetical protein